MLSKKQNNTPATLILNIMVHGLVKGQKEIYPKNSNQRNAGVVTLI